MKILFLTLLDFDNLQQRNIYSDLLREFYKEGHSVYVISPTERRNHLKTKYTKIDDRLGILKVKIGNIQKTNIIEKGISTITLEKKFISAIKKFYGNVKFDLILYTTPPITLQKAVAYVKKRDQAVTYLMLKDIFPQNAVDLGVLSKTGIKGLIYKFFRSKECKLYRISDYIGCMSEANRNYILDHNREIDDSKVEVCPNSLEPEETELTSATKEQIRERYGLPKNKKIVLYGGNLGKPQGIDFLLKCISKCENPLIHFVIVGGGTEFNAVKRYADTNDKQNLTVISMLSQTEYGQLVRSCEIGLVLLDRRFSIPNFPSRILAYMQAGIPVIAATDINTDIGKVICEGGFGYWSEHGDVKAFLSNIDRFCVAEDYDTMCCCSRNYFMEHYTAGITYRIIVKHF